ncbi:hypothetical protein CXG81DRAFT_21462 [Caulochytrium protostelioides]|uniref:Uncharacterized protein n=1 Tax=Caulochytrium protostelioides TaxID=1555241 RepID=A0A4P9X0S8_9FUNG|nr:hypothetical protein CXG81DRAFT_21462 [Caulochytrium protostelioides]|eukprot:RKO98288.1 hypothetical protein CXG81DRAFT_21462 [Caulochytrium protostelioides]
MAELAAVSQFAESLESEHTTAHDPEQRLQAIRAFWAAPTQHRLRATVHLDQAAVQNDAASTTPSSTSPVATATASSDRKTSISSIDSRPRSLVGVIVHGIAQGFAFVFRMVKAIGMRIYDLIVHRREVFNWNDIVLTTDFLNFFFELLGDVGYRGLTLIKQGTYNIFESWEDHLDTSITHAIEQLGGHDMTPRNILKHQSAMVSRLAKPDLVTKDSVKVRTATGPSYQAVGHDGDAKSLYIADRWLNNINSVAVDVTKPESVSTWSKFMDTFKKYTLEMLEDLKHVLVPEEFERFHMHILQFTSEANFLNRSIAHLLNFIRSLAIRAMGTVKSIMAVLVNSAAHWWNLCLAMLNMSLPDFFLSRWWSRYVGRGRLKFSLLHLLNMYGAIFATAQHKFYNNFQAPFSAVDIKALRTTPSHELILYTWNHHPATASHGDKSVEHQRLGIYDWVPRQSLAALSLALNAGFLLPLVLGGGNTRAPGGATLFPQFFNNLVHVMFRIASYPLTQLKNNDPASIAKSMKSPNPLFLGSWASAVYGNMFAMYRPLLVYFAPKTFGGLTVHPSYAVFNIWIVAIPTILYRIPIQLATGRGIAKDDNYRYAVYMLGWVDQVVHSVEIFIPFLEPRLKAEMPPSSRQAAITAFERMKTSWVVGLHALLAFAVQARSTLMSKHHIVGMLSSSWQPVSEEVHRHDAMNATVASVPHQGADPTPRPTRLL